MIRIWTGAGVLALAAVAFGLNATGGETAKPVVVPEGAAKAYFAAGCFWCAEKDFEHLPGVYEVVSGYMGGAAEQAEYGAVSSGRTGHLEAVEVIYDPQKLTYDQLLYHFWRNVDPLQGNGQFCDKGPQYRSAIFAASADETAAAEASKAALATRFPQPVVTLVLPAGPFYPAEGYHQDYAKNNEWRYTLYRTGCGRDAQLAERWGAEAGGAMPTN